MALPTLYHFDQHYNEYENKEELLLTLMSIDVRFIKDHAHEIDFDKVRKMYKILKVKDKLKPTSIEFKDMVKRELHIQIDE